MKVAITARNFNSEGCDAIQMLKDAGLEVLDYEDYPFQNDEERLNMIKDADFIIPAVEEMQAEFLSQCKNLKAISLRGIGYDNIDANYCKEHHIALLRTRGALEATVAEQVIAYIMHFARQVNKQSEYMHNGEWNRILTQGAIGKTLGLVGFGEIGKEIAKRGNALGMNVIYYCRHPKQEWEQEYNAKYCDLDDLLAQSDYVSLNIPLTAETRNLFDKTTISKMKKGSVLINIARGAIVDYYALREAIENGDIAGAGIDVYEIEPCTDCVLKGLKNVVLTPHTAPYTKDTFINMNRITAQNILDYINGKTLEKYTVVR